MSKDKRDSYVILRGKVDDIRIQNITALLFMYEGNQKILLDKKSIFKNLNHPQSYHPEKTIIKILAYFCSPFFMYI